MSRKLLWLPLVLCCAGCAAPQQKEAPVEQPLTVSLPYDAVWRATVDTIESRFEIAKRDYENGLIVTQYKAARTLLEPWGLDTDDTYQAFEETFNKVRRRCTAQLTHDGDNVMIELSVTRERLNYEPPPTDHEPGPPETEEEREEMLTQAAYAPKEQWTFMENDERLAQRLLSEISRCINDIENGKPLSEIKSL